MKVSELAKSLGFKIYTAEHIAEDKEVNGCYIGDLLSHAMAKLESGNVWVTIQTNINIAAVASLTDVACIIIADGFEPDDNTIEKANAEDILILGATMSAYQAAVSLAKLNI